jgi:hypothetical protein
VSFDAKDFPDPRTVLLPSRAYLRSFAEQNLPAREAALDDAVAHFEEAAASEDLGWRDMALLGVIGEAMQLLEDLAYIGTAYEKPLRGIAHYVTATVYTDRTPNNFYSSLKKWDDTRLKVLLSLYGYHPQSYERVPLYSAPGLQERLEPEDVEAIQEAERATVAHFHPILLHLAQEWEQFRRYFHAFKHGGLVINRDDVELVDEADVTGIASISVWLRKHEGTGHGDTSLSAEEVVDQVTKSARWALRVARYLVEARLRSFEAIKFADDGSIASVETRALPYVFRFPPEQVSEASRERLQKRFGIEPA